MNKKLFQYISHSQDYESGVWEIVYFKERYRITERQSALRGWAALVEGLVDWSKSAEFRRKIWGFRRKWFEGSAEMSLLCSVKTDK